MLSQTPNSLVSQHAAEGRPFGTSSIQVTNLSMRQRTDGRLRPMTAKEKLLERVMTLSEAEADEALRLLDALRDEAVDEWASLSKVHEVAFGDSMQRLSKSERAGGHEPW